MEYMKSRRTDLQKYILAHIDEMFHPKIGDTVKKILEISYLNDDLRILKITNQSRYDILKLCFSFEVCSDVEMYNLEKKSIDERIGRVDEKRLQSLVQVEEIHTYPDFIQTLYTSF